jgi:hypothetical protein
MGIIMKQIYAVEIHGGFISLIAADSFEQARKQALADDGSGNVKSVKLASEEDIDWVRAMNGYVPELKSKPTLPSEWAQQGYFVLEGWRPEVGAWCDYYDREGKKRQGTVKAFDGTTITIDGERTVIVTETFKVRQGR